MTAPVPPILSGVVKDIDRIVAENPRYGTDVLLLCAAAFNEAGIVARRHAENGSADGFVALSRALRALAQQIEARVPVRVAEAEAG